MVLALTMLAIVAYGVALFLLWRDRSFRPLLLLLSGSLAMLSQPVWAYLFGSGANLPGTVLRIGQSGVPYWTLLGGGVLIAIPPLIVIYGLRHGWWGRHYLASWGFFGIFFLFYLILDAIDMQAKTLVFARPSLPTRGLPGSLLHVVLLAGVSFGLLYTFVATRHYALRIALLPLLLAGLGSSFLFNGILASPFWVIRFLNASGTFPLSQRFVIAGAVIAVLLILWGIHLLASGLHAGRRQQLRWR